ncbi:MAG TPA: hypothetical protein VLC28_15725, partial [Flavitalea sp.]|nr:hypothetical protein [Flavitalea sp.]
MRHFFLLVVLVLNMGIIGFAQGDSVKPVTWTFSATKMEGGKVTIRMKALVQAGWKLFSTTASDDEPNTRVIPDTSSRTTVVSIVEEGILKQEKEPLLDDLQIKFFNGGAVFNVLMEVKAGQQELGGSIEYMALKGQEIVGPVPVTFRFSIQPDGSLTQASTTLKEISATNTGLKRESIQVTKPAANCGGTGAESAAGSGLLGIFFIGFLGGLVALLTPCVFPMIPLTVSFFTKKSGSRKKGILDASLYGFFILLIYVLLSIPFHFLD